ncbi:cupin domain-containing protein [Planctomicrobium piriforme]|uniref:Cupin 2 domain-containing protein n=1 Tax=Planctomicrobium piriforme TaxID=1576369 RepID=A0A1I3LSZ9_9PLAN|nr:cupin domain-containing protein [Planctomicrobium piriforme]SFI87852.1 cupin 2 domain-containing protein [Planctomicrobium piriforme]
MSNLFADLPTTLVSEQFDVLLSAGSVRIERIVSTGQSSPPGFWYDQSEAEWVVVLQGAATLRFESEDRQVELKRGEHVLIPAHVRHRVEWTTPDEPTVWLAVFYVEQG